MRNFFIFFIIAFVILVINVWVGYALFADVQPIQERQVIKIEL